MPVITVFALLVMGAWLVASVAIQFRPDMRRVMWWFDLFLILPHGRLFVKPFPNYLFLYRDRRADGTVGSWQTVSLGVRQPWYGLFWNAPFWFRTELHSQVGQLSNLVLEGHPDAASTIPYRAIRNYLTGLPRPGDSAGRQFMILLGPGHVTVHAPRVLFTSAVHPW